MVAAEALRPCERIPLDDPNTQAATSSILLALTCSYGIRRLRIEWQKASNIGGGRCFPRRRR